MVYGFLLCIANILHFSAKSKCGLSRFNISRRPGLCALDRWGSARCRVRPGRRDWGKKSSGEGEASPDEPWHIIVQSHR